MPQTVSMPRNMMRVVGITGLAALMIWGCSTAKGVGPAGPDGKPTTWSQMSIDQRKAHMKKVVVPLAAEIFQSWRPQRYAKVDCTLCHGAGDYTGNYHMPTDHLPRLSGKLLLGPERAKYPDTTQLKLNRLVPEMADALGVKRFNLVTRRGFGCYSCHLGPNGPMFGH